MLHRFHLDPHARLKHLSKGQYAKVGLALALAPEPEILILDEPTSGIDLLVRREFLSSMVDLAGQGRTILISSHQIAEVERIASHVAFLASGQLVLAATMEELRERLVRISLRFEDQPPDPVSLGTVLHKNGSGRQWQAILQNPNREAIEALRTAHGIFDLVTEPLALEDAYAALVAGREVNS
jgi:ABC-2 type transport system ATP-binding protein